MRRNVYSLSTTEWDAVVAALNQLKGSGQYDDFTRRHQLAMNTLTLFPGETGTQRNQAHRGPALFPWHRQFVLEFEGALGMDLPYWPWHSEGAGWRTSAIWNLVGGNGDPAQGGRITTGPFAGWTSIIYRAPSGTFAPRSGIIRNFASASMPTGNVGVNSYDASPWNESTLASQSYRRNFEVRHNRVHANVGGDMRPGTAPNDPVFWLHHCNVDRWWATWQEGPGRTYVPTGEGPPGHNLNDVMGHLQSSVTPADVLDWRALGISYDALG